MSSVLRKQDMPPPGGYSPIIFKRIPAKSYFNGYTLIGAYLLMTGVALGLYGYGSKKRERELVEMRSSRMVLQPLLLAERDREYLKTLRRNRDYEVDLMKNVKGWEVGKLFDEPLYRSLPEDSIADPGDVELYVHSSIKSHMERFYLHHKL